jgi:hypothetical protein
LSECNCGNAHREEQDEREAASHTTSITTTHSMKSRQNGPGDKHSARQSTGSSRDAAKRTTNRMKAAPDVAFKLARPARQFSSD